MESLKDISYCVPITGMENLKEKTSKTADEIGKDVEQNASNWSEIVKDLVEKLTGKDMVVTYDFDNLEFDIPKATGPGGQEIGSAKWKINGRFVMSTQVRSRVVIIRQDPELCIEYCRGSTEILFSERRYVLPHYA